MSGPLSTDVNQVVSETERRRLLERVVASDRFQKAARLRDFLLYVGEKAISDQNSEIHVSEIAEQVFGRGVASNDDTIVRVHATQLRRRLAEYFSGVGADEPIIIEIPKGNYAPVFKYREQIPHAVVPVAAGRIPRAVVALGAVVVLMAVVIGILLVQNSVLRRRADGGRAATPSVNLFWSRLLDSHHMTDIVLADSSLSLLADVFKRPAELAEYADRTYWQEALKAAPNPELAAVARMIVERRYTSIADASVVRSIGLAYGFENGHTTLLCARDFQPRNLKSNHVILLGSKRSNPWGKYFEGQLNFRSGYEESLGGYFENRQPRPGEQRIYRPDSRKNELPGSYCEIAFLPNIGRTGNVLLIAGTDMEATESGGEFLTHEDSMLRLRHRLNLRDDQPFPYFEILLRTTRLVGTAPEAHVVADRLPAL